jgi:hypothetical protein
MVRFLRFSKILVLAAALGTGFALAAPQAASADHDHYRGGFWLPLPPPPSFFFPRVVVHRHGPYCGHYDRYDRYDRYERRDGRYERWERRHDRHERHGRW